MLRSFPGIVKSLLKKLPNNDYPVLNTRLFVQIWLNLILDKSLTSLRDLFFRLNHSGISVDISTFSKACKQRGYQVFNHLFRELLTTLRSKRSRFCDYETKVEYRLATNVPTAVMTDAEIGEAYRYRWQIELLWKFLKMHLKLDKLMTKSINGVRLQIYAILIVYLLLQLMEIPQVYGATLLNKLRFIHLHLAGESNFISWSDRILP